MTQEVVQKIRRAAGLPLEVVFNDNRSTFLRIYPFGKISLHRLFLKAPDEILQSLGRYLVKKQKGDLHVIRNFIQTEIEKVNYAHRRSSRLVSKGKIYDLQEIFDRLNEDYFEGKIEAQITYFPVRRSRDTLYGKYMRQLRLIKINEMLDSPKYPRFFVEFVVYHEMVHALIAPTFENGRTLIHNKAFKAKEKQHIDFERARQWEKKHGRA